MRQRKLHIPFSITENVLHPAVKWVPGILTMVASQLQGVMFSSEWRHGQLTCAKNKGKLKMWQRCESSHNSSHKINTLSYVFLVSTEIYPPSGSCTHTRLHLVGYRCLRVDIYLYSAKKHRIIGSITHEILHLCYMCETCV